MDTTVAAGLGLEGKETLRVLGHNILVRKCKVPELTNEQGEVVIALCDKTRENTNWCEVLAVGEKVGKPRWKVDGNGKPHTHQDQCDARRFTAMKVARWYNMPAKPGDFVVLPETSERCKMWRAPLGWAAELLVDECECILLLPAEHVA